MNRISLILASLLGLTALVSAAVPPPEQLLPGDTLGLISIPDWDKAAAFYAQSPASQLWQDPALKAFKDNFLKQFTEDVVTPLERELGVKFGEYADLVHGQVTFAVTQSDLEGAGDKKPGILLVIDSKGQAGRLKEQLTGLKKKWVDAGKQIKTEKIRDVEFTTLVVGRGELNKTLKKAFPIVDSAKPGDKAGAEKKEGQFEITFGQSESLLVLGNSSKEIEKILIRQAGGSISPLADQAAFEAGNSALFRDAFVFGWLNFKPIYDLILRELNNAPKAGAAANPMAPRPEKILAAIGLGGLKTIAFKVAGSPEGSVAELFVGVPESGRQGIFKILVAESKDASPPPFVPADAVKYSRWRLDGRKAWATIESMIASISPEVANLFQMGMATIGKDKDPNFDLKKSLIGNLGDDFIAFEKNPKSATFADLTSPPALFLVGSPDAEKLAQALNTGASVLAAATGEGAEKEREFLGRKVYSVRLPSPPPAEGAKPAKLALSFAAGGGYLALSTDTPLLEDFLRSAESSGKSLRETPGLNEAAQRVGGMSTGLFGFENQAETMRVGFETLKNDIGQLEKLLSLPGLKDKLNAAGDPKDLKDWFDFSLLPTFDKIAKYFHVVVYGGSANADGLSWKMFAPTPPQLRK